MKDGWFEVDKKGLQQLRAGASKSALVYELTGNVFDTDATECDVATRKMGPGLYELTVRDDDPEGFRDLRHAYTLFAESIRKADANKRGRFNLGEKLSLAVCESATIATTKGTVIFDKDGRRERTTKTQVGSVFTGIIRMSAAEHEELVRAINRIIVPEGISLRFQGTAVQRRLPIRLIESVVLPTVLADNAGALRPTKRKTAIEVHGVPAGQVGWIYELGIPVVETGDTFDYNVLQKVPLTIDRSNVTHTFLREVRLAVAEAMSDHISRSNASSEWVRSATSNPAASPALIKRALHQRFGAKAVIYDPSDKEANAKATAHGFRVIHGGSLNKAEWENVRKHGIVQTAGKLFPTSPGTPTEMPDIPAEELTAGMKIIAGLASRLGFALMGVNIRVRFIRERHYNALAHYGDGELAFNLARLPAGFFDHGPAEPLLSLLIHEFGHQYEGNHLSEKYYDALSDLGARLALLVLEQPEIIRTTDGG